MHLRLLSKLNGTAINPLDSKLYPLSHLADELTPNPLLQLTKDPLDPMLYEPLLPSATKASEDSKPTPRNTVPQRLTDLIDYVSKQNPWGTLIAAIDPGDVHVGIALGTFDPNQDPLCVYTVELTQAESLYFAANCFRYLRAVVLEIFTLFPDKAASLSYSTMPTSRLIGALEYIASVAVEGTYYQGTPIRRLDHFLFEQLPSIQVPSRANLKARGLSSHARTHQTGDHCLSAELHLYYWLFERLNEANKALRPAPKPSKFESPPPLRTKVKK